MIKVLQNMVKYICLKIFTDGSKNKNGHCGIGMYIPEFNKKLGYRLNNHLSVFTVEMSGIITALRWIEENKPIKSVMCTDSMAALQSLESNISVREDLIIETRHILLNIRNLGIEVQFCWVPAHIGIKGNEKADKKKKHWKKSK